MGLDKTPLRIHAFYKAKGAKKLSWKVRVDRVARVASVRISDLKGLSQMRFVPVSDVKETGEAKRLRGRRLGKINEPSAVRLTR